MIPPNIYAWLICAVIGFGAGWQVNEWRHDSLDAVAADQQRKAEEKQEAKADAASESHEEAREQIRTEVQTVIREVPRVVEKPVYRNVCFDAGGLRLISKAIGDPIRSGEPSPAVPAVDDAN